jgi:hypothetical protein
MKDKICRDKPLDFDCTQKLENITKGMHLQSIANITSVVCLVIDCRGEYNIGAVLNHLTTVMGKKINYYFNASEIIASEVIGIYAHGLFPRGDDDMNKISGIEYLHKYAYTHNPVSIQNKHVEKTLLSLKKEQLHALGLTKEAFAKNIKTIDGTHREYYKGYSDAMKKTFSSLELALIQGKHR